MLKLRRFRLSGYRNSSDRMRCASAVVYSGSPCLLYLSCLVSMSGQKVFQRFVEICASAVGRRQEIVVMSI